MFKKFLMSLMLACGVMSTANAALMQVDLELQLLVDVSGSVSSTEYNLQTQGYVDAFNSSAVQSAILGGVLGKIAVQYIEWSSQDQQAIQVDWFLIDSAAAATSFATAVSNVTRAFSGLTAIGSALNYGASLFDTNDYDGTRQVMDLSGDGETNDGAATSTARDNALAAGIDTINAIAIQNQSLASFYTANVIGGTNPFVEFASDFDTFKASIERKLIREIAETPEVSAPASISLVAFLLLPLLAIRRKLKA